LSFALTVIVAVTLLALAITRRVPGARTVLLVGITTVVIAIVAVAGLITAVVSGPPVDVLHWLYGALALAALPIAALVGARRPAREQALVLLVGAIALALFIVRLIQTG
jgi:hypothetical protein